MDLITEFSACAKNSKAKEVGHLPQIRLRNATRVSYFSNFCMQCKFKIFVFFFKKDSLNHYTSKK